MKNIKFLTAVAFVSLSLSAFAQDQLMIVKLEQTPGKFTEQTIKLKPGSYVFEVANNGIDHEVAFFLQAEKDRDSKEFSTALPNSGLAKTVKAGESAKSGPVKLEKGTYVYSCPLNPTPKYTLLVE